MTALNLIIKFKQSHMEKEKGTSIKQLQNQMKKQLTKLAQNKAKSQCFSRSFQRLSLQMYEEQPERSSFKSNSSRKQNTSITVSSKPPQLLRQNSLEAMISKHTPSCKNLSNIKIGSKQSLKKKKNKKDSPQPFMKLKRGDTLPQQLNEFIVSTTSLELKCDDSSRKQRKSVQQYEKTIEKYKTKIDELEKIIESLMQC